MAGSPGQIIASQRRNALNTFPSPGAIPPAPGAPTRNRRAAKRSAAPKPALTKAQLAVLLLLLAFVIAAGIGLWAAQRRMEDLTAQREAQAQAYEKEVRRHQTDYRDLIEYYAYANGIDPAYVAAIIKRESDYDPGAVSRLNARGLMQIMPDTAQWLAGKVKAADFDDSMIFDPETSIKMGCWYLGYLSGLFDGDPILIACAYHAGQGNVRGWVEKYSGNGKTLALDEIPMEDTRYYAGKVLNAYAIYQQHYYKPQD